MPARLISAPRAYVYTKDQSGTVHNFSSYVVSGQVQRKLDQVSSAEIVLRNPGKRFTTPSKGVAFHPMDPVTIYLERIQGYPVRVFTGYLDTTPYYQLFPGTITLKASCTLKRLLYTYFDPSLPYVIAFFTKYGWINTGQGSIISSQAFNNNAATQAEVNAGKQPFNNLQDGSLGKLLWAILYDIGEWQDANIYVENLPSGADGLAARMAKLMTSLQASQAQASADFTTFLHQVIGGGDYGSGGAISGSGNLRSPNGLTVKGKPMTQGMMSVANILLGVGTSLGAPRAALEAVIYAGMGETSLGSAANTYQNNGAGYWGVLQGSIANWPDPHNVTGQATSFFQGGKGFQAGGAISLVKSGVTAPDEIAVRVEVPSIWPANAYATEWSGGSPQGIAEAKAIVDAYLQNPGTTISKATASNTTTQSGATAPSTQGAKMLAGVYVNPFAKAKNVRGERYDQGVDYACDPGDPIVALGDCVYDDIVPDFWQGQPMLIFKLTSGPLAGLRYYYAEGVNTPSYPIGTKFNAGQTVTTTTSQPTGLEFGWASTQPGSGQTYAQSQGATSDVDSISLNASHMWGRLMKILGAPMSSGGDPGPGPVAPNNTSSDQIQVGGATGGGVTGGATGNVTGANTAQAFVAELQFPSVEDQVTAIALGSEHKGLMHDQSLMPFVQQVCQASMRTFQSLPNGDFYAFYPDYFGEFGHHKPYWFIRDIEILDGGINLSDDALATHVFAVGDNTWPVNQELLNMLFSAGTVNVFNAFVGNGIIDTSKPTVQQGEGLAPGIMNADEAIKFIQRYGARPLVQNYPMVRSPIYEMLLAYQQFMMAWSNQFKTPFTFTFMPELFPGGKVGFPDHGIQMFINSVTHEWSYEEGGFTTTAELAAPSLLQGMDAANFPDIPPQMVSALIEPLRPNPPGSAATPRTTPATTNTITDPNVPGAITNPLSPFPVKGTSPFGNNIW